MTASELRIRILVDNRGCGGMVEEHGLAVWIEAGGRTILFDTGQGGALAANAAVLGCDLGRVDTLVLSHGHYDHSGAISQVLQHAPSARVCCHPGALVPRYSVKPGEAPRTIAVAEPDREALLSAGRAAPVDRKAAAAGPRDRHLRADPPAAPAGGHRRPVLPRPGRIEARPPRRRPGTVDRHRLRTDRRHRLLPRRADQHRRASPRRQRHRQSPRHRRRAAPAECLSRAPAATCAALREWDPEFVVPCHCTGEEASACSVPNWGKG